MPQEHICGKCGAKFETDVAYVEHTCKTSGVTPIDPKHTGDSSEKVSAAALARGKNKAVQPAKNK